MAESLKTEIVRYDPNIHGDPGFYSCGNPSVDSILFERVAEINPEYVVYVWINEQKKILGYFALSCYSFNVKISYKQNPKIIPAFEIKALSLLWSCHGKKFPGKDYNYSDEFFKKILATIEGIARYSVGAEYVYLSAVPKAVHYYERHGFIELDKTKHIISCDCKEAKLVPMMLKMDIK